MSEHSDPPGGNTKPPAPPRVWTRGMVSPNKKGRPKGQTLSQELRRQANVEEMAAIVLRRISDPKTSARDLAVLVTLHADRTEGKSVARSINLSAERLLPLGFDVMPAADQAHVLRQLRARAIAGTLTPGVPDVED